MTLPPQFPAEGSAVPAVLPAAEPSASPHSPHTPTDGRCDAHPAPWMDGDAPPSSPLPSSPLPSSPPTSSSLTPPSLPPSSLPPSCLQKGLEDFFAAVQRNCDIADANFAGDDSLCTYLLKMREYYRWAQRLPFFTSMDPQQVGQWVSAREQQWESLESLAPETLPLGPSLQVDPFAQDAINAWLLPAGMLYGSGLIQGARPSFFVGSLLRQEVFAGYHIMVVGEEKARDLAAPPAMSRDQHIFVRRESVRRMLFEKMEAWEMRGSPAKEPLAHALRAAGAAPNVGLQRRTPGLPHPLHEILEQLTDVEVEMAVWHEIGEILAQEFLTSAWQDQMLEVAGSRQERVARAVRDLLADCLTTLPALLGVDTITPQSCIAAHSPDMDPPGHVDPYVGLHLYFAHYTGLRAALFPQLRQAYADWTQGAPLAILKTQIRRGREHWLGIAQQFTVQAPEHWPVSDAQISQLQPDFTLESLDFQQTS